MTITPTSWLAEFIAIEIPNAQADPQVTGLANGNFLVVWEDDNDTVADGTGTDIVGVIFNALGEPVSGLLFLNDGFGFSRSEILDSVSPTPDGGFVIVYTFPSGDDTDLIFGIYDAAGARTGGNFVVSDIPGNGFTYSNPSVAVQSDGSFFVTFERDDGTNQDIVGRRFDAAGVQVGVDFELRVDGFSVAPDDEDILEPRTIALANGGFATVYSENDTFGGVNERTIELRLSSADGTNGTLVNNVSLTDGQPDSDPRIVQLADGRLLIAWVEAGDVRGRIFNEDGSNRGSEFNITNNPGLHFADPEIVALEDGGYFTVFRDDTAGRLLGVRGADGAQQGTTIIISNDADGVGGDIGDFSASLTTDGRILVSWENGEIYTEILDPRVPTGTIIVDAFDGQTTDLREAHTTFNGSAGNDIIHGLDGDDTIEGRQGADTLDGGDNGVVGDTLSYANSGNGVAVDLRLQTAAGNGNVDSDAEGDTISGFENVTGSNFADQLSASGNGGRMVGLAGEDLFILGGTLISPTAPTVIDGGDDTDTIQFGTPSGGSTSHDLTDTVISSIERFVFVDPGIVQAQDVFLGAGQFGAGGFASNLEVQFDPFSDTRETIHVALSPASNVLDLSGLNVGGFVGSNNSFDITGSTAADTVTGSSISDVIDGGGGDDLLNGGAGADAMSGGADDDTYVVDDAGDTVIELAGGGIDTVRSSISHTLATEVENLVLLGTANLNGSGNGLANTITGNTGNNVLNGFAGSDTLIGGLGDDQLFGGGDGDFLFAGSGTDLLNGGGGADAMTGGKDNDTYFVDDVGDTVIELAGGGIDTVNASISHALGAEVENLILTGATNLDGTGNGLANTITGNAGNNVLNGFAGTDTLVGGLGFDQLFGGGDSDFLFGGSGNDVLNGGAGADAMTGGIDNDTYVVDNVGDTVIENAGGGTDTVNASITHTLAAEVENLILTGAGNLNGSGNGLANAITGNTGNNVLNGFAGADTLVGGLGLDQLFGGADADQLFGGGGDDVLGGGAGNDTLTGGLGNDTLTGGVDADIFVFGTALNVVTNVDTITDYSVVDDTIHLDDAIFSALGLGALLASAFRFGAAAVDADDRIIYQGSTGNLFYDVDGVGGVAQVQFASLTAGLAMSHTEFVVI